MAQDRHRPSFEEARAFIGNPVVGRVLAAVWLWYVPVVLASGLTVPDWPLYAIGGFLVIVGHINSLRLFGSPAAIMSQWEVATRTLLWYWAIPAAPARAWERPLYLIARTGLAVGIIAAVLSPVVS